MGNTISRLYDFFDCLYQQYYPKSELLRPSYLCSAAMVAKIAAIFFMKEKRVIDHPTNFLYFLGAGLALGTQTWVTFVSGNLAKKQYNLFFCKILIRITKFKNRH
jgi:hypothetical protein